MKYRCSTEKDAEKMLSLDVKAKSRLILLVEKNYYARIQKAKTSTEL